MKIGTVELLPERIPAEQRAALAWILRNSLETADQRAAQWSRSAVYGSHLAETARVECLRSEVLTLIAALEGDGIPRALLVEERGRGAS